MRFGGVIVVKYSVSIASLAAVAAIIGLSGSAQAQQFNWTGLYVGGEVGGGWGQSRSIFQGNNGDPDPNGNPNPTHMFVAPIAPGAGPDPFSLSGAIGGLKADYLIQSGGLVMGVGGAYDWSGIKGSSQVGINNAGPVYGDVNVKSLALINGKLGVANGSWLAYAEAGVAIGNYDASVYGTCGNGKCQFSQNGSATHTGWDAGAGISYAISNNLIFGVEYNHIDLGSSNVTLNETLSNGNPDDFYQVRKFDPALDVVKATLSWKFGGDRAPAPLK